MRSCRTCERYLIGENGEVSTDYQPDATGQGVVEVPSVRPGVLPPPCVVCPKWPDDAPQKRPLTDAEDLFGNGWLWDVRQMFLEGRAVGDLAGADPFMRAVYAELDLAERRIERVRTDSAIQVLAAALTRPTR